MSSINWSTQCPCGHKMEGRIKKPTLMEHRSKTIRCIECASVFLMVCWRVKGADNRLIKTDFEEVRLSEKARNTVSKRISSKAKFAKAKVLNAIGIEPKPDKTVVETQMDLGEE